MALASLPWALRPGGSRCGVGGAHDGLSLAMNSGWYGDVKFYDDLLSPHKYDDPLVVINTYEHYYYDDLL